MRSEDVAARLPGVHPGAVDVERSAEPPRGPFGAQVRELTLPGWLTRDVPQDPELVPTEIRAEEGDLGASVRFTFGPLRFLYDRLGLRRDDASTADPSEDIADA